MSKPPRTLFRAHRGDTVYLQAQSIVLAVQFGGIVLSNVSMTNRLRVIAEVWTADYLTDPVPRFMCLRPQVGRLL